MAENHENPKKLLSRYCFSEEKSRANLLIFSEFGAA